MLKRFRLQTGHVVKVDECDAYLLRIHVFRGYVHKGRVLVLGQGNTADIDTHLSRRIMGPAEVVVHLNGDPLDFTRANLKAMTRSEWGRYSTSKMRERNALSLP